MQQNWQSALKDVITRPAELLDVLGLNPLLLSAAERGAKLFPLRVPRSFVSRIQKGNPDDPLLRQILPLTEEEIIVPGFSQDPLNEKSTNPVPGLLHKYNGRVLIVLAGACAINCRYCFRRHFPYQDNISGGKSWAAILDYIAADSSIYEVIFSGGDPLLANDNYLAKCMHDLAAIPHLKTLRIHSRLPIVLPQRITPEFASMLTSIRLQAIMVIHCNHANELDHSMAMAIDHLRQKKIIVLNQSVLLRGVNDDVQTLIDLSQRLFEFGILPYYLNLLDKVQGAAHFAVSEEKAKTLVKGMRETLSGYLVPNLVKEQAGAAFKLPLF